MSTLTEPVPGTNRASASARGETGPLAVRLAEGRVERDAVFRFRHRVLARDDPRRRGFTASGRRLVEPADLDGTFLAAFDGAGEVHAVVRIEPLASACARRGYRWKQAAAGRAVFLEATSYSSRLLVDPAHGGHLAVRMLASLVHHCSRLGFTRDVCASDRFDGCLRTRLGYRDTDELVDPTGLTRPLSIGLLAGADGETDGREAVGGIGRRMWRRLSRRGAARP
ncbi:MAG: hypothetical protein VX726_01945 [Planctomycetota bacterium]|nr:hypothetical protein [Planctomycetota bacterium]